MKLYTKTRRPNKFVIMMTIDQVYEKYQIRKLRSEKMRSVNREWTSKKYLPVTFGEYCDAIIKLGVRII